MFQPGLLQGLLNLLSLDGMQGITGVEAGRLLGKLGFVGHDGGYR